MSPSTADFAEILMLQQYRKLYEEQEEKNRARISEKEERMKELETALGGRNDHIHDVEKKMQEMHVEMDKMRADYNRLKQEAQEKIDKLMDRIKELNQRLMGNGGGEADRKSGIFR